MRTKPEFARVIVATLIAMLLAFPFVAIVWRSNYIGFPLGREIAVVFGLTMLQAALSAFAALIVGIAAGTGLLWAAARWSRRAQRALEGLALLPNAAPVLVMLLAVVKFFPSARDLGGIVLVHVLLNAGLIAVAFAHLAQSRIAGIAELAYIEGASGPVFFRRGALPMLAGDLALLYLFVFALCFTSFAVPLALGGSRATTIEVLIYQKIRISGDWSQALGLALMQMAAILAIATILRPGAATGSTAVNRQAATPLLQWRFGLVLVALPAVILLAGLADGVVSGIHQAVSLVNARADFPRLLAGSCLIGFVTGVAVVAALLLLAFVRPGGAFRRYLTGYAAPSAVLTGFALLIVWRALGIASYFKISLGLMLIALPSFYRYEWDSRLRALEGQVAVARTLGAGPWLTFARVVFPQVAAPACFAGGLAALWSWGDFALTGVVAERNVTVAQTARALMGSYRLDAATFYVWVLLAGGLATFAIFLGAGHVLGSKPEA